LNKPHAVIIGAGIGGLVAALDLAGRGLQVTVFERSQRPGGKLRAVEIEGRHIDSGPTVFTMPWVFEELFAAAGSSIGDHLCMRPAELLARHAWRDGSQLDLFADIDQSAQAIAAFSSRSEAERYRAFCARAQRVYRTLDLPFMRSQRPSMASLIKASGLRGLVDLWRIRPFESLWRALGKSFHDPRLRGLFARYATYCGSSPLQAPATLMLIAHVEQAGVWQMDGGMRRLADAIAELLEKLGGKIYYDTTVREIDAPDGRVQGVQLASGAHVPADVVVANTDVAGLRSGLLGESAAAAVPRARDARRSLSAITWSLLAETSGFELAHHNVFFPDDYPQEFNDIFGQGRLPAKPAVYICAQDRGQGQSRHTGPERLFLITNAPAVGDRERFEAATIAPLQSAAFQLLRDCGLRLSTRPDCSIVTTPADFEARFPGTGGALYGSPAHGWRSSFSRPGSRSRIPGLYLAGGSVHPGPGVPMVALSGRLAAAAVAADLGIVQK
jgi:1-hydroxycarotenoid 3,4-desaturase